MPCSSDEDPSRDGRGEPHDETEGRPLRGRRGGRTTVTPEMVRKTYWIDREIEDRLREDAYRNERTESEIVRQALRDHYEIESR